MDSTVCECQRCQQTLADRSKGSRVKQEPSRCRVRKQAVTSRIGIDLGRVFVKSFFLESLRSFIIIARPGGDARFKSHVVTPSSITTTMLLIADRKFALI